MSRALSGVPGGEEIVFTCDNCGDEMATGLSDKHEAFRARHKAGWLAYCPNDGAPYTSSYGWSYDWRVPRVNSGRRHHMCPECQLLPAPQSFCKPAENRLAQRCNLGYQGGQQGDKVMTIYETTARDLNNALTAINRKDIEVFPNDLYEGVHAFGVLYQDREAPFHVEAPAGGGYEIVRLKDRRREVWAHLRSPAEVALSVAAQIEQCIRDGEIEKDLDFA